MTQSTDTDIREIRDLILGLDRKIETLDKKVEVNAARTDERLNSLDLQLAALRTETATQFGDLKEDIKIIRADVKGQDARLWGFVVALFLSLAGVLTKVVFFAQAGPY
jgi:t-SNARE complex subunit (syntaxin)